MSPPESSMTEIPSTFLSRWTASASPLVTLSGRSIWVASPVTTIFDLWPIRVKNIFICTVVVFCASSRMMKVLFSVRPLMNAKGAISITSRSRYRCTVSKSRMSPKASKSGRRYGLTFPAYHRGENRAFHRFNSRSNKHDLANLLVSQSVHCHSDSQIGFAGAGRARAEDEIMLADRFDVSRLPLALGKTFLALWKTSIDDSARATLRHCAD